MTAPEGSSVHHADRGVTTRRGSWIVPVTAVFTSSLTALRLGR